MEKSHGGFKNFKALIGFKGKHFDDDRQTQFRTVDYEILEKIKDI